MNTRKVVKITIEGRAMTGKSTIARVISDALEAAGYNVVVKPAGEIMVPQ